ncbi:MAG TPA: methyltransferase domain-containing protein [Vicinamibacterales bacterium]|nr:methyltransferase domain-containing protein [Vicinamibacterales bacterium]
MVIDPEQHEVSALLARLPAGAQRRVVEIGCGDGRLTRRYSSKVASVLAIDPDAADIALFRSGGVDANVDVRAMSIEQLHLPDASVEVVLFSWAL